MTASRSGKKKNAARRSFFKFLFGKINGGFGCVLLNALDTVYAAGLGLVAFAGGDDLTVASLQAETVLAGLIEIDLKLRVFEDLITLDGLILDAADTVALDALFFEA